MKELEVGDIVSVRGMDTVHEVVSVIGRTRQVHLRCLVTGEVLEYVDASAVKVIPVYTKPVEKKIDGIGLGDTVVPVSKTNNVNQMYTVIGINLSHGTYDLCNNITKKIVKNVPNRNVVKYTTPETETIESSISNGDRVTINGYTDVFTVVNTYTHNDDQMVDLLQLVQVQTEYGSYTDKNRIDFVSINAVQRTKVA